MTIPCPQATSRPSPMCRLPSVLIHWRNLLLWFPLLQSTSSIHQRRQPGYSGVATGGSDGSMNRGPRAPGGPEPGDKKIKQENNRHTSEKKLTINRYTRDSCVQGAANKSNPLPCFVNISTTNRNFYKKIYTAIYHSYLRITAELY